MAIFILGVFWCAIVVVQITLVDPHVYYVSNDDRNGNTLRHYLDNAKEYFKSDCQLVFFPGEYQLDADLVFEGIRNFTLTCYQHLQHILFLPLQVLQ